MSHYITASFGDENEEKAVLSYGVSWRTLSALRYSGLDIYALYEGENHDAGMSGDGTTAIVSPEQCASAYQYVIAWVVAMEARFPEAYQAAYGLEIPKDPNERTEAKEIGKILDDQPFPLEATETMGQQIYDQLCEAQIDEDRLDRSIGYVYPVLLFAKTIYEATSRTHREAKVGFH